MKRLHRFLIGAVGVGVLLALAAVFVVRMVFTRERILAAVTPRIAAAINRPLRIGEAGVSFSGGVGVWLGDITVGNRPGFSDEPLLALHRFDLKARLWPLLLGRVEIDHVTLVAPSLLWQTAVDGTSNLDSLIVGRAGPDAAASPPADADDSAPPLQVDHIRVLDGTVQRQNGRTDDWLYASGINLDLQLNRKAGDLPLGLQGLLTLDSLTMGGGYDLLSLGGGEPRLYLSGEWDAPASTFRCDSAVFSWWGAVIAAQGIARRHPALTEIQLNARLQTTQLSDLTAQLGAVFPLKDLGRLDGIATGELVMGFIWPLPEGSTPEWRLDLDLEDISWNRADTASFLTLPRLEIRGEEQTLSWSGSGGRIADGSLMVSGTIDRIFSDARTLSARLRTALPAASLSAFMPEPPPFSADGLLHCDLSAFGRLADLQNLRIAGDLTSERILLADSSWSCDSLRAAFKVRSDGEHFEIRQLDWTAGASAGYLTGEITGLVAFLRSGFESPDLPRATLTVRCRYLDLDQLLRDSGTSVAMPDAGDTSLVVAVDTLFPHPFILTGMLYADTMIYNGLPFSDLSSAFAFEQNVLRCTPAKARLFGGRLRGSLQWDISNWNRPTFAARVRADSVEANEVMQRYFGWEAGIFGQFKLDGRFGGNGRTAEDISHSLTASGRADMRRGRFEAAPLLAGIGHAGNIPGLEKPRTFRDLAVPFTISHGRVRTDKLRFSSGDARFLAVGSFGLDRSLDYRVTVSPSGNAAASSPLRYGDLEFSLKGTVAKPIINIDASHAAESFLKNLLPAVVDSARTNPAGNILNKLLNPKKP